MSLAPVEALQREIDSWREMIADDPYREGVIALAALELAKADTELEEYQTDVPTDIPDWEDLLDYRKQRVQTASAKLYEALQR